mgnify:FL=1
MAHFSNNKRTTRINDAAQAVLVVLFFIAIKFVRKATKNSRKKGELNTMMIAVFISNDDKIRLIKEEINKIDPNVVIYEEEKDIIDVFDNDCIIDEIYNNYEDKNYEITENELNEIAKKVCKLASDEGLPSAWKDFNNLVFSAIKEYESEKLNKAR